MMAKSLKLIAGQCHPTGFLAFNDFQCVPLRFTANGTRWEMGHGRNAVASVDLQGRFTRSQQPQFQRWYCVYLRASLDELPDQVLSVLCH